MCFVDVIECVFDVVLVCVRICIGMMMIVIFLIFFGVFGILWVGVCDVCIDVMIVGELV